MLNANEVYKEKTHHNIAFSKLIGSVLLQHTL